MKVEIKFDHTFKTDFAELVRRDMSIASDFRVVLDHIREFGEIPAGYNTHLLDKPGGMYSGFNEFHLREGKFDVVVIFSSHGDQTRFRFVRIGSRAELFR